MLSTTRIEQSLNTSIENREIKVVLFNIYIVELYTISYIAELYTISYIPSVCPNNRLHDHCHLATDLVTILTQICQKLWDNSTSKSER